MSDKQEKFVGELPARRIAYNYDTPSHPFTPEQISYIESIREFFSDEELAQARRLESFHYNTFFGRPNEIGLAGLRTSEKTSCLYLRRYGGQTYAKLVDSFLHRIYETCPKESLGGVVMPGYRGDATRARSLLRVRIQRGSPGMGRPHDRRGCSNSGPLWPGSNEASSASRTGAGSHFRICRSNGWKGGNHCREAGDSGGKTHQHRYS